MLPLGHQRCSVMQISAVQGSVFQHYARHFISVNPRFQCCASYIISINPRFSVVQELSGIFGHQRYTKFSTIRGSNLRVTSTYFRTLESRDYTCVLCNSPGWEIEIIE